jgi:hypothetical protein
MKFLARLLTRYWGYLAVSIAVTGYFLHGLKLSSEHPRSLASAKSTYTPGLPAARLRAADTDPWPGLLRESQLNRARVRRRLLLRLWLAVYALTMLAALADATCWSATANSAPSHPQPAGTRPRSRPQARHERPRPEHTAATRLQIMKGWL